MFRSLILLLVCQMVVAIFFLCPLTHAHPCGDCNFDGAINVADIVYLMNYCFLGGPPPGNLDSAEADGYEFLNIRDAVYLVNYLFWGEPPPTCPATHPEYQCNLEPADTIKIPPTTLLAGDSSISVFIWYKNSKPIRGIALPLKVNVGEQIPHIDSVVLGTRIPHEISHPININNVTGTVNSGFLWTWSDSLLAPGSGPIFTLYLSIDPEEIDRRVLIDTLRLAPSNSPMFIEPNTNGDMPFFVGLRPDSLPFAPAVNYGTDEAPYSVFCADLDGDTDLDLAVANGGESGGYVSILKNYGNGTFESPVNYAVGSAPQSVFCADLDGDGDPDLAVANCYDNNVSILKNNGNGTFESPDNYAVGYLPRSVFCADLDGDGDPDLAVANSGSDYVSILKNNGDGTFQDTVNYGAGYSPYSIFCADLDGDFDLDLAVANLGSDNVSILKNNGNGTFASAVNYGAGGGPSSVFCADLDGDSDLDLAVANAGSGNVSILKNNGNGTFQTAVNWGAGDTPYSVFCADLDGDLDLDLALASAYYQIGCLSILKNNGNGTFKEAVNYEAGDYPQSVFCADLDGDGDFDLAAANEGSNDVSILENLSQIPANQPPWAFHLISPGPTDTTQHLANFVWRIPYDPNLGDQIRYDLYISTTPGFEPQTYIVDSNLVVPHQTDSLQIGTYYWKVKAQDNWGAYSWSQVTFSFFHSDYISDIVTIVAFSPVDLIVTDPKGDSIGIGFNTIPNASYDVTQDWNQDGDLDDIVTIPDRLVGTYLIRVVAEPGDTGDYDLGIRIDGSDIVNLATDHPSPPPDESDTYSYNVPWYVRGDANGDWKITASDVVYLINYLYIGGPAPEPLEAGDVNCDGTINAADVVYLINYMFISGPPPCG
jgi:hypothetical protein